MPKVSQRNCIYRGLNGASWVVPAWRQPLLAAKELELLKDAVPHASRIGVLWNPTTPSHAPALLALDAAAKNLKVQLRLMPTRTTADSDRAFATVAEEHLDGFLVLASPLGYSAGGARQAELALKHHLPGIFGFKDNAEAGGLMSYSADIVDLYRRGQLPSPTKRYGVLRSGSCRTTH